MVTPLRREGHGRSGAGKGIWRPQNKLRASPQLPNAPVFERAKLPPTEQRNPRSANLDKMPVVKAIELMASEDAKIPGAILEWRGEIAKAVVLVARAFKRAGGCFMWARNEREAGRSGRKRMSAHVPHAAEAGAGDHGGRNAALVRSWKARRMTPWREPGKIKARKVTARDVVVGISASGRTPFVWGALDEAKRRGAKTVLLCFNPFRMIAGHRRPALVIAPQVGRKF